MRIEHKLYTALIRRSFFNDNKFIAGNCQKASLT